MTQTIYHGSDQIIEKPVYGGGKPYNDYGLGFYCTFSSDMAKEWGVTKDRSGFANRYLIDTDDLTILDLNSAEFCILHWLTVLLENREFDASSPLAHAAREYLLKNFTVDYRNCDCITGYRADDSYFSFARDFISGAISYRQLNRAMHLGSLGIQFVLKSRKAFERIVFDGFETAPCEVWYPQRTLRDSSARSDYFNPDKNRLERGDIFITQIINEEMTANDPRLR